ncbi:signal peptidase I [Agrococcus casei]|uniref:signal peptidase I n=1 Tax=Agrococcus casei TaxID=343512 RepID=UPI003F925A4F
MTHTPRRAGRQASSWVVDALLWVLAVAGAVCILLVILAHTMGITLMMFSTGSMSPTIPAGSVAVVQETPATAIEIGDVVTVDRGDLLPVTHRVTSVEPGAVDDERVITMRGDANEQDDPHPYTVETVRTVLFSIPGLANVIVWFGDPLVLGGITIAAALLVGWAFWPRAEKPRELAEYTDQHEPELAGASQ